MAGDRMRMFPLGSVLFPMGVLPLHVFEPRYLQMIAEAVDDDGTFGVVLIERGSEVGGGDQRFSVGTAASILQAETVGLNRLGVVAVGTRRLRVVEWLPDDPYPQAVVERLADPEPLRPLDDELAEGLRLRRRILGLASELGLDVGDPAIELSADPRVALWQLSGAAPITQLDRQRLLEVPAAEDRMEALLVSLRAQAELLEAQLSRG